MVGQGFFVYFRWLGMRFALHDFCEYGLNGLEWAFERGAFLYCLHHEFEHGFAELHFDNRHSVCLRWDWGRAASVAPLPIYERVCAYRARAR